MPLFQSIKDHHAEKRIFVGRVIAASIICVLMLSTVIARLIQLQVFEYEHYAERAQGNRFRIEAIPPTRGLIFDRKGRVLAENLPAYQLELIPEQVPDLEDTLRRLAVINLINQEDIPRIEQLSRVGPRFKPVTLSFRLTEEEIANFAIQRPRFPGVDFQPRLVRHYPHGMDVAHAIGYVGALSTTDLNRLDTAAYTGTAHTGKTGLEYHYESNLHGDTGHQQIITNARGRQIPLDSVQLESAQEQRESPKPGDNIYLSLDLDLQIVATNALKDRRGAVVAIDPRSGEILALVSAPDFDPNYFPLGMSHSQYASLINDPDRPLFNRAIRGQYPPGSTIKPILAIGALEEGIINASHRAHCSGSFTLPGSTHRYRDWKPEGHGSVNLHDAITQSCDVYFYEISNDLGIDNMHDWLNKFGLGYLTGIDVDGEKPGLVPSREWKRNAFQRREDRAWFPGETVIASIGQGYMLATPLQLASAVATIASHGKRFMPHLVTAIEDPISGERTTLHPVTIEDVVLRDSRHWDMIIDAMHDVMQGARGTARAAAAGAKYQMAGKSGTAQVFTIAQEDEYEEEDLDERLKDHALFIAFAPLDDPQIAVAVVIENGSSGSSVAAPIARAVMDKYLETSASAPE